MISLIPDTSALINLNDVYVGRRHIYEVLDLFFDIRVPIEIRKESIRNKARFKQSKYAAMDLTKRKLRRIRPQNLYDTLMLSQGPSSNPQRNAGERCMCSLALYEARRRSCGRIVLLTDDLKATNGFISWFKDNFQVVEVWNSLDLLQYIYSVAAPKWPKAQAESQVRKLNALVGGGDSAFITKRLLRYRKNLTASHDLISKLPRTRVRSMV